VALTAYKSTWHVRFHVATNRPHKNARMCEPNIESPNTTTLLIQSRGTWGTKLERILENAKSSSSFCQGIEKPFGAFSSTSTPTPQRPRKMGSFTRSYKAIWALFKHFKSCTSTFEEDCLFHALISAAFSGNSLSSGISASLTRRPWVMRRSTIVP